MWSVCVKDSVSQRILLLKNVHSGERVELQRSNGGAAGSSQSAAACVPFFDHFLPVMRGVDLSQPLRQLRRLSPISSVPLCEGGRVSSVRH